MFTIIAENGADYIARDVAAAFDQIERMAIARQMWGGHDIHGTRAIAYHEHGFHVTHRCGGHEIARVFDTRNMNATTAASLEGK
jgi:hypothetical protein